MSHRNQLLSLRLLILLMAIGVVFLLLSGRVQASTPAPDAVTYVVRAGDTLWAIAGSLTDPGVDVRRTISAIMDANGLAESSLQIGQVLRLPAG
jgi:LysM repeat protein